jgi:REJ domain
MISLPPYGLSENITYAFTVQVSSLDGRTSTQTAVVTPTVSGSAQMTITTSIRRFNEGARVVLVGNLFAPYAVTSQWSIRTPLGVPVPFGSLTPKQRTFNASDALAQIAYPLSVNPYSLPGGSTYVFRLSVHPTSNPHMVTFAEIALTSNPPPTGGYITPNPTSGDALVTLFTIASPGWTADAACFPLSLSFAYAMSPTSAYYTLAAPSLRGFTTATLPAGSSSLGHRITLFSAATDIFNSSGNATATVVVKTKGNVNLTRILDTTLNTAFSAGNVNLAFQTINNVSTELH